MSAVADAWGRGGDVMGNLPLFVVSWWLDEVLSGGAWQGKGLSRGARFPLVLSSAYNNPLSLAVRAAQMEEQSSWERSDEQSSLVLIRMPLMALGVTCVVSSHLLHSFCLHFPF